MPARREGSGAHAIDPPELFPRAIHRRRREKPRRVNQIGTKRADRAFLRGPDRDTRSAALLFHRRAVFGIGRVTLIAGDAPDERRLLDPLELFEHGRASKVSLPEIRRIVGTFRCWITEPRSNKRVVAWTGGCNLSSESRRVQLEADDVCSDRLDSSGDFLLLLLSSVEANLHKFRNRQ